MRSVIIAGLLWCGMVQVTPAQRPLQEKEQPRTQKKEDQAFTFEMRGKSWASLFEWLTDKTGKPFVSRDIPPGTFNFIAKKGQQFTIPEIIDIINDGLLPLKYVLINRRTSFTLVPADLDIDQAIVPRITPKELMDHGQTEVVSTILKLKTLVAEDLASEVKKQMGPFGKVVTLASMNQLLMQDTAGNLQRIIATIQEADQAETFYHKCIYIRAREAEAVVRNTLGDQQQIIEVMPAISMGQGGQGAPRQATKQRIRVYNVSADEHTNTIFVSGPPDKIAQAKGVLARLDVGIRPVLIGSGMLQTYPATAGNAEILAKNLADIYKGSANIRIVALGTHQIMVWAQPEDHFDIAKQIEGIKQPSLALEMIPLKVLDAARVLDTLKAVFPDYKNLAPYIESDPTRNAIIVKGTAEQIAEVKAAIRSIGENDTAGNWRIIILDKGGGATLAEAVQKLMSQVRPENPVRIVPNGVRAKD